METINIMKKLFIIIHKKRKAKRHSIKKQLKNLNIYKKMMIFGIKSWMVEILINNKINHKVFLL